MPFKTLNHLLIYLRLQIEKRPVNVENVVYGVSEKFHYGGFCVYVKVLNYVHNRVVPHFQGRHEINTKDVLHEVKCKIIVKIYNSDLPNISSKTLAQEQWL